MEALPGGCTFWVQNEMIWETHSLGHNFYITTLKSGFFILLNIVYIWRTDNLDCENILNFLLLVLTAINRYYLKELFQLYYEANFCFFFSLYLLMRTLL